MARRTYPECKGIGHVMYTYNPARSMIAARVLACPKRLYVRCDRCTTVRHDGLDDEGNLVPGARQYIWPPDYRDGKDDKPTRAELRLIIIKRPRGR